MRCILEGEASIIHITNPGSRTADTLSFPSSAPGGVAQGVVKVPAEMADKRFLFSEGQSRYCVRAALLNSSRSVERQRIRLLAALAIVMGTWLQT